MKKGLTELIFVLDRSGSMSGLEEDTIGGFNSMLKEQKELDGEVLVTTVLFDSSCSILHDRIDINALSPMTREEYRVGGNTALLDALGIAMHKVNKSHKHMNKDYIPEKVIFVIITDGMENSSTHYTAPHIRKRIEEYQSQGWKFLFFGATMDVVTQARNLGITADTSFECEFDKSGARDIFSKASYISRSIRSNR